MKYPDFLKEKGTISLVAPSFGANIEPYHSQVKKAIKIFKEDGYIINEGPNVFEGKGIGISNSSELCAKELMDAYLDDSDIIISVGGGEMMCSILPHLDFNLLKDAKPKWFMGFSDNTNFSFTLTTLCDIATINGHNFNSFSQYPRHKCLSDSLKLLTGKKDLDDSFIIDGYPKWEKEEAKDHSKGYNLDSDNIYQKYPLNFNGQIEGRLLVGTLDCLVNLCGTYFDNVKNFIEKYKNDGIVWVFDACELMPFSIARALWQLKNAGWFKYTKGFIFGKSYMAYNKTTINLDDHLAIVETLKDLNVPIIMDFEYGHFEPSMPFINGSYAIFDINDNKTKVKMILK